MKPLSNPTLQRRMDRGFALIVTLSLMILLTIIAVGLLSLSAISLRASAASTAQAEARQNARMAMQLAIGQLQLLTGHDARVTASSDLMSATNPPVAGAWRSWEGTDRDASGKPVPPKYDLKKEPADLSKAPGDVSDGRFLGWLASPSASSPAKPDVSKVPDIASAPGVDLVPMVSDRSTDDASKRVYIKPTKIKNGKGSMAWWSSGENSKAMVNKDRGQAPTSPVTWQQRVRSNGRVDSKQFGLEKINDVAITTRIPTTSSLRLLSSGSEVADPSMKKIHDITAYSLGLLTNTAVGGWRKDLSLFSERYSSLPSTGLPTLTIKPGVVRTSSKAQPSSHPANALLYPWGNYRSTPDRPGWAQAPPICSWNALVDYTQQYKALNSSSAASTRMPSHIYSHGSSNDRISFQDKVRRCPQIARIQWIFSLGSAKSNASNDPENKNPANTGKLMPGLVVTPVLTLWNPYNVELTISSFGINIQEVAPLLFTFKVGSRVISNVPLSMISRTPAEIQKLKEGQQDSYQRFNIRINQQITLKPGASRIFSVANAALVENGSSGSVDLVPGYKPKGGYIFFRMDNTDPIHPKPIYTTPGTAFSIEKVSYDAKTKEGSKSGLGIIYDISVDGGSKSAHRMIYEATELGGPDVISKLYPPISTKVETTVDQVEGVKNRPFTSAIFGYRMASALSRDPAHRHLYSKGMLQANPLCFYTEIGFGDDNNAVTSMAGTGVYHPINAPYDFVFQPLDGWNDTLMPQWEQGTGSSYIVSGLMPSDGLTRCVMAELPTRPIQSLVDLQHFDVRNNNPIPPFQYNLIGNGSANPIFGPQQVSVQTTYNNGMCNDDTYMLNHVLFDDWFVSSIATDLKDHSPSVKRSINNVYKDHLELAAPLPNRFYIPARGASSPSVVAAVNTAVSASKDAATGAYSYETIASKLEVEGMFNINSVSLDAWKALLKQGRDTEVPFLEASGATSPGKATSFSFPRTSIAGDQGTDSNSKASNALFPQAAEFAGHRVLTDEQIDALAEEIVKEVRSRGPFLSLSEFVNRRLSGDKNLAIAGAIQKALDNLASSGSPAKNPFAALKSMAVEITQAPPGKSDYKFPEAALGSSAFGVPGWVRQADILRPLAPIISARDDTFKVRAYGDARDPSNPSKVIARAWCEVVVRRQAEYVDPAENAGVLPYSTLMKSAVNKRFGRRYELVSFRWLDEREI